MWHRRSGNVLASLLSLASCACTASSDESPSLHTIDASQFIVPAETTARLEFSADNGVCSAGIPYFIQDYAGVEETQGAAGCAPSSSTIELSIKLHRGYHELRFPTLNSTFGVIALDRLNQPISSVFGVDTAFSYLVSSPAYRSEFIGQLSRLGFGAVRDRITWSELRPNTSGWNGTEKHQFDDLRRQYAEAGIKVMDVLQGLPEAPAEYFPSSADSSKALSLMATHWGDLWDGIEIANEPDHNPTYDKLSAGGQVTYQSRYARYAALVSGSAKKVAPSLPVVGGAFAFALSGDKMDSSRFANGIAQAGLLDSVDAISFHTYVDPVVLKRDIGSFKDWLHRSGKRSMPLWITEAGWPWKRGSARPPLVDDQSAALQIAGKAVVAYAMGVERYYAFVYPYYEEKEKNFGMTGKERTPLRSLAAYAQAAKTLSGARVISPIGSTGDHDLGALFSTPKGTVMVIYRGSSQGTQSLLKVPFRVLKAEGIDGRHLDDRDGGVSLSDGLAYIWIEDSDVYRAKAFLGNVQ